MAPDPVSPIPATPLPTIRDQLQELATRATNENQHDVALDALRLLSSKPGVATTEFYLSLGCSAVGTALSFIPGKEPLGAMLLGVATLAYALSRGIAKKA